VYYSSLYGLVETNTKFKDGLYRYIEDYRMVMKKQNKLDFLKLANGNFNKLLGGTIQNGKKELDLFKLLFKPTDGKQKILALTQKIFKNKNLLDNDKKEKLNQIFSKNGIDISSSDKDIDYLLKEKLDKLKKTNKLILDFMKVKANIYTYGTLKIGIIAENSQIKGKLSIT
jgi:hypothetical protein